MAHSRGRRDGASAGGSTLPRAKGGFTFLGDGGVTPSFLFRRRKVKRGVGISPSSQGQRKFAVPPGDAASFLRFEVESVRNKIAIYHLHLI